jgi:hypothetical protein
MRSRRGEWTEIGAAAAAPHVRVTIDSNDKIAVAGVEEHVGTLKNRILAADDLCTVIPAGIEGTRIMVASGAIGIGDDVYPDASGKVTATVQGRRIGKALTATSNDGEWIEVQELPGDANDFETTGIRALTGATMTITAAMCKNGKVSTSHSGAAQVDLPAGKEGMRVTITKIDANAAAHTITPNGAEKIQGAASFAAVDAQFDTVTLEWMGGTIGWNIAGKHIA